MNLKTKRRIIVSIIIVIILVAAIIGGLIIYLRTDLLKSNDELFLKYIGKQYEMLKEDTNNQYNDFMLMKKQSDYETNATVSLSYESDKQYAKKINENLNKTKINLITKYDNQENSKYANLKVDYDKNNFIDISYVKSNNIYALKWEEIILNYYLGIRNENLKVLAQKVGIGNTEYIPDEFEEIDIDELLKISSEEKQYITDTYFNLIKNNISKEKYTKQKDMLVTKDGINYNATAYRLDLTSQDIKNIKLSILENLKQDSITLNLITTKAKMLKISEDYTTIKGLTTNIQKLINQIDKEAIDESKGLSIVVYEYKSDVLKTELILKNDMKISIDASNKNNGTKIYNIDVINLSSDENYNTVKINITEQITNTSVLANIDFNIDNKQLFTIKVSNVGLASNGDIETNIDISITDEDGQNLGILYEAQTKFGKLTQKIPSLGNTNCLILNDYSTEYLNSIIPAIGEQLEEVILKKTLEMNSIFAIEQDEEEPEVQVPQLQ